LAKTGNPDAFHFPTSHTTGLNYSFSGIKTAFLYFIQNNVRTNPNFINERIHDICASYQKHLIKVLLNPLQSAAKIHGINDIAIAGGVSANSELRRQIQLLGHEKGWRVFIPAFEYCTDNAAMIAITGYFKYLKSDFCDIDCLPLTRYPV
jgi:N6-L-threonylcarbamoyladenine synthase